MGGGSVYNSGYYDSGIYNNRGTLEQSPLVNNYVAQKVDSKLCKSVGFFTIYRSRDHRVDLTAKQTRLRLIQNGRECLYDKLNDSVMIAKIEKSNREGRYKWELMDIERCSIESEYFVLRQCSLYGKAYAANIKVIKKTDAIVEEMWGDTTIKAKSKSNWQYYRKRS